VWVSDTLYKVKVLGENIFGIPAIAIALKIGFWLQDSYGFFQ